VQNKEKDKRQIEEEVSKHSRRESKTFRNLRLEGNYLTA